MAIPGRRTSVPTDADTVRSPPPSAGFGGRTSSGSILTPVGQCPGTRPTMFGHAVCCAHGLGAVPPSPGVVPITRTHEVESAHEQMSA